MIPLLAQIAIGAAVVIITLVIAGVSRLWQSDCSDLSPLASRQSCEGEPWWERQIVSRRMSIDAGLCRVCGKPTSTQCGRCKSVKYCSISCQRKDWGSNHKFECDNLQKLAAAASSSTGAPSKPPPLDPHEDAPVPTQVLFPYQHYLQLCHSRSSCRRPPIGLTNLGNNCYANAALQCLLANRPLRAYLDQGLHSSSCNKPHRHEWCLLCELQMLCRRMAEASPGDEVSVRPLLRHLRRFAKTLSYGRQEDAHEFFYSLLNTMEAIQLTNYGGKERFDMRSQETTLVHHVFAGYLRSQVICGSCGAASRRYEAALDLQLEVPPGVDRLEDALARHTADEVLDGDNRYACDGCKQRCCATRSTRFEVAPNSLVLCIKRFGTGRFGKINKMLAYGEHLDLKPYMAQQAMDNGDVTYTLGGVVVHLDQMNSTSFGHYICFVRTADGRWYTCDDSRVAATSPSRVLSQNAYMLFYQRDTPKPAPQPGYKRHKPLTPAAAAGKQAAAVLQNGTAVPESDVQRQQQDQEQQGIPELLLQQSVPGQEPQQQQQLPPLISAETLARVSTAPAALVHMGQEVGSSSSSKDDEEASRTSSSSLADAGGSESSTPSTAAAAAPTASAAAAAAAAAAAKPQQQQQRQQGTLNSSNGTAANGVPCGSPDTQQPDLVQTSTPAVEQQREAAVGRSAAAAAATNGCSSSSSLPKVEYHLERSGPELLQLRAHLPGVLHAADVCVDVVSAGPALQRLQLKVPGRFAPLDVPLPQLLGAAAAAAGGKGGSSTEGSGGPDSRPEGQAVSCQVVAAVSGKLYRQRQMLSLKLHLVDARGCDGTGVVHWHSTDSTDAASSSGSESDGSLVVATRSIRSVMSEMDLSSFFGRHSSGQMMQGLRTADHSTQQQQQDGAEQEAGAAGSSRAAGTKQKSGSSKKGSSKKGKGKKKK